MQPSIPDNPDSRDTLSPEQRQPTPKPPKPKRFAGIVDVRRLFMARITREGKKPEYDKRMQELRVETGKGYGQIQRIIMLEMGYQGPTHERLLAAEHEKSLSEDARLLEQAKLRVKKGLTGFDAAVASLPQSAPIAVEIDWIRSHPAMARKNRSKSGLEPILITVDDILHSQNGKAPSQAAVFQLQHWSNLPQEFYKQILSEHKKKSEGREGDPEAIPEDIGLAEVENLLKEVTGAV